MSVLLFTLYEYILYSEKYFGTLFCSAFYYKQYMIDGTFLCFIKFIIKRNYYNNLFVVAFIYI